MSDEQLQIERVELARIKPGKNPRKRFDLEKVNELAVSIRLQGIIQPLIVRPDWCVGKTSEQIAQLNGNAPAALNYEIIAGERRWRAANQEKLATAPVIVRLLSDQDAMELHMIEQLQHADWTPIEEADGFRMLLDLRNSEGKPVYTTESLGAKISKTKQYVSQRLKLLLLPKLAREALESEEISPYVARLIGSIPNAELREKAALEIVKPPLQLGPMNRRQTRQHITMNYMRSLLKAPFPLDDATLVPIITDEDGDRVGGLACTDCPMRVSQRGGDLCTNLRCYAAKADEVWRRETESDVADGNEARPFLNEKDAAAVFGHDGKIDPASGYVDVNQTPAREEIRQDREAALKRWREMILGPNSTAPVVLARNPATGKVFELAERKLAVPAAEQNGFNIFNVKRPAAATSRQASTPEQRKQRKDDQEKSKLTFTVSLEAMGELVFALEAQMVDEIGGKNIKAGGKIDRLFDALIDLAIGHAGQDGRWMVSKRRGLGDVAAEPFALGDYAHSLSPESKPGLIIELLLGQGFKYQGLGNADFKQFAELYGIDVAAVEARVRGGQVKGKGEKLPAKGQHAVKASLGPKPSANGTKNQEHAFEKIAGTKYRCKGCGAAAVKQGRKLLVEKSVRGKPCAMTEAAPARKSKRQCSQCSNPAVPGKSMCQKCLTRNAARVKARRKAEAKK